MLVMNPVNSHGSHYIIFLLASFDGWGLVAVLINIFYPLFFLMSMPVMNIGHVIVLMFLGGVFMLVRVNFLCFVMSMRGIIVAVTVFME